MKNPRYPVVCACCVFGGVALGVFGARVVGGSGARVAGDGRARVVAVADARVTQASVSAARGAGDAKGGEFPDLAGIKSPEECRAYIERWLAAECPAKNRRNVMECLRRWSEVDAEGALALVHGAAKFSWRNGAYAVPLTALGAKNMPRVIEWLQKSLPEADRSGVATGVIMGLKETNPIAAWELALAPDIPVQADFFGEIMKSMVKTNPADALRVLDSLSDDGKRDVAGGFAVEWLKADPNGALAWCVEQRGKPFARAITNDVLNYYAEQKPGEICAVVERLGVEFGANEYYGFMHRLTSSDPLAALEILQKMPSDQMRRYGSSVVRGLFRTDADQAVAAAQVLLPEGERTNQIMRSYREWVGSDRKAAEAWLATEADAGLRDQIKLGQLCGDNPSGFLASLGAGTDMSGAFIGECIDDALRRTGYEQPGEAMRWLLANPDQITESRLRWLMRRGDDGGLPVTFADISGVPEGKARERLIGFVANDSINRRNWGAAAGLLPMVTDVAKQDMLRYTIFSNMMSNVSERDAAREWLATQPLSDDVRASWERLARSNSERDDDVVILNSFPVY